MHKGWVVGLVSLLALIAPGVAFGARAPANHDGRDLVMGRARVRMIRDGRFQMPVSLMRGIEAKEAASLSGADSVWTPLNAFLVSWPGWRALIDAGYGPDAEEDTGHVPARLRLAGVEPDSVDLVLITHSDFDHLRAPYVAEGAHQPFAPGEDLGHGLWAHAAIGHTPGHAVFELASGRRQVGFVGDLVHFGGVQSGRPGVTVAFDSDSAAARASRIDCFTRAARAGAVVAGTHLPAFVRLERHGAGFTAKPLELP